MGYILLFSIACCAYFLPTLMAYMRGARNRTQVFVLNLVAGWTLVGWVVALVWSFQREVR